MGLTLADNAPKNLPPALRNYRSAGKKRDER